MQSCKPGRRARPRCHGYESESVGHGGSVCNGRAARPGGDLAGAERAAQCRCQRVACQFVRVRLARGCAWQPEAGRRWPASLRAGIGRLHVWRTRCHCYQCQSLTVGLLAAPMDQSFDGGSGAKEPLRPAPLENRAAPRTCPGHTRRAPYSAHMPSMTTNAQRGVFLQPMAHTCNATP